MLHRRKVLICYSNASTHTDTTLQYLQSFARYGNAEYYYFNVVGDIILDIHLDAFDAVIVGYCARLCIPDYVSKPFIRKLARYTGLKAVIIQDEYDHVERERVQLDRISPDIVFTCIPADQQQEIYPSSRYPSTEFVQVLTGYHHSDAIRLPTPVKDRPIDIGYRARSLGLRYGALAMLKCSIGELFLEAAKSTALVTDISLKDSKRLYGKEWSAFLSSCKTVLGSPSGSNIFDFDGSIADMSSRYAELSTDERNRLHDLIAALDNTYHMNQISPRVFEAASTGSAQVLYRDHYSGILEAGVHFIPVELDGSNISNVLESLEDLSFLQEIANNAYEHLVLSGNYSYESLVRKVESTLFPHCRLTCPSSCRTIKLDNPLTDMALDPRIERPTLAPRSYDSYQLRSLLYSLRRNKIKNLIAILFPRLANAFRKLHSFSRSNLAKF